MLLVSVDPLFASHKGPIECWNPLSLIIAISQVKIHELRLIGHDHVCDDGSLCQLFNQHRLFGLVLVASILQEFTSRSGVKLSSEFSASEDIPVYLISRGNFRTSFWL